MAMLFLLIPFFNAKAEKGCCIKDKSIKIINPNNCVANMERSGCTGVNILFYPGDLKCENPEAVSQYCGDSFSEEPEAQTTDFPNPLKFTTVSEVVNSLLDNLRGIVALIAIVFIIIGGVMYMMSSGNEKMIESAKKTITASLIGMAIVLAAPTFLKEIKAILGGSGDEWTDVDKALTIKEIALRVVDFLLSVIGILGIIGLVIGGVFYLTAYGDEDRIDTGKKILTASLIGIAIAIASVVLVRQIASLMGVPM